MKYRQYLTISLALAMGTSCITCCPGLTYDVFASAESGSHRYALQADGAGSISSGLTADPEQETGAGEASSGTEAGKPAKAEAESLTETETESLTEAETGSLTVAETGTEAGSETASEDDSAPDTESGEDTAPIHFTEEQLEAIRRIVNPLQAQNEPGYGSEDNSFPWLSFPGTVPAEETGAETEAVTEAETGSGSLTDAEAGSAGGTGSTSGQGTSGGDGHASASGSDGGSGDGSASGSAGESGDGSASGSGDGSDDGSDTETGAVSVTGPEPIIGEAPTDVTDMTDPSQSSHSLFRQPHVRFYNPARVSLYDYRMLRDYPLSSLPRDLHTLYDNLSDMAADYDGTWSVYVEDLSTRQALIVGDRPMKSASTMKLFIMAAVYDQIDKGRIERTDEVVSLLHDMISNSSNEAANRLLLLLGHDDYADGVEAVDRYISEHGYSSATHEYNGFEDSAAVVDGSHFNQISAKDIGLLLERVYSRNFISRKVCNEIEDMMLNQATRYKIPKGLPEGVEVANKTGEMDTVENDCAVVYGSSTDFILVVLSMDWDDKNTAQTEIQKIAGTVYEYLN